MIFLFSLFFPTSFLLLLFCAVLRVYYRHLHFFHSGEVLVYLPPSVFTIANDGTAHARSDSMCVHLLVFLSFFHYYLPRSSVCRACLVPTTILDDVANDGGCAYRTSIKSPCHSCTCTYTSPVQLRDSVCLR